jgi:hypothetical protein
LSDDDTFSELQKRMFAASEGTSDRTAQWAVAQLKEHHPALYAQLLATHLSAITRAPRISAVVKTDADDEIQVATGQAMSI